MMTHTKGCVIALGLAAFASAGAMTPAIAAPKSKPAAVRASDDATQVRSGRRGSGSRSVGRAVNDRSGWSRNSPEATGGGSLGYNRNIYYN
jgi:hypothetical protein